MQNESAGVYEKAIKKRGPRCKSTKASRAQ